MFDQLNGLLRRLVREAGGRDPEPSACVLDAQSVKTSANVPAAGQGIDAGKKMTGRTCHIGVDTLGPLSAVWVTAASVSDNAGGIHLLSSIAAGHPRVTKAWADTGYRTVDSPSRGACLNARRVANFVEVVGSGQQAHLLLILRWVLPWPREDECPDLQARRLTCKHVD